MTTDIDAILAQRAELKRRDPEMIYLFRVADGYFGDTYQAFREDALAVFEAIRGSNHLAVWMYAGSDGISIRATDLDAVLGRIVAAGKRAAVCEPVGSPVLAGEKIERIATTWTPTTAQAKLDEIQAVIAEFRAENVSSNLDVTGRAAVFTLGRIQGILVLARD